MPTIIFHGIKNQNNNWKFAGARQFRDHAMRVVFFFSAQVLMFSVCDLWNLSELLASKNFTRVKVLPHVFHNKSLLH
jgi:uncharacterized membrane protein